MPNEQEIPQIPTRKRAMLDALEKTYGIVTPAAKLVGIDRTTHYDWYHTDPIYKAAVDDMENASLDHTESKLKELIEGVYVLGGEDESGEPMVYKKEPNSTAVIFHLKTRGKKRGYVERTETELVGEQKVVIHKTIISTDEYNQHRLSGENISDES